MSEPTIPPHRLPTLTEVVAIEPAVAPPAAAAPAVPAAAALPPEPTLLTEAVLADVQRQIDLMLEVRLRELLAPVLARAADGLVREARTELARALREMVTRAVAREIARQRGGGAPR